VNLGLQVPWLMAVASEADHLAARHSGREPGVATVTLHLEQIGPQRVESAAVQVAAEPAVEAADLAVVPAEDHSCG